MLNAKICILKDPAGALGIERAFLAEGDRLFDFLIDHYGGDGFSVPTKITRNGREIDLRDHTKIYERGSHDAIEHGQACTRRLIAV